MSDTDELAELHREVRYLRDRLDIIDCVSRYSRGIDRMDFDLLASVYHDDAIDEHGAVVSKGVEFLDYIESIRGNFKLRLHSITTHNCDLRGDEAHAESYVLFGLVSNDSADVFLGGGRYVDRFERRKTGWKIAHRRTMIDWFVKCDNSPFNSPQAAAWGYPMGRTDKSDDSYERPLSRGTVRTPRS